MKHFKAYLLAAILGASLGLVFYRSVIMMIIFSAIGMYFATKIKVSSDDLILLEFRDLLNCIHSELLVGMSFRNAIDVSVELQVYQSTKLKKAILLLNKSTKFGMSDIKAWQVFSNSMNIRYISEFVRVLEVTYNYSGNVTEIIQKSIHSISDAIDLTLELGIMITAKKFEFYMMMLLPVIMLGLLSYSQYDYMSVLYQSTFGRIVMSGILISMCIAYIIGKEIIKVEPI